MAIVGIATRPTRRVTRVGPDGAEHEEEQVLPPQIDELRAAVQSALDSNMALLEHLRDTAVFELTARKLEQSKLEHRTRKSAELVKTYTGRAVVGGLAAISPGTDILIQGYLGTRMVKSLCELYEVPAGEIELQKLLTLTQKQVRTALPLLLAVAGNAAKAFPGVGTLGRRPDARRCLRADLRRPWPCCRPDAGDPRRTAAGYRPAWRFGITWLSMWRPVPARCCGWRSIAARSGAIMTRDN